MTPRHSLRFLWILPGALLALFGVSALVIAQSGSALSTQSQEEADKKSAGCVSCHTKTDAKTMHAAASVRLGCQPATA